MRIAKVFLAALIASIFIAIPAQAATEGAKAFYSGKTMTIIVPYGVGGHFDSWARLIGPFMAEELGLESVHVVNRPGGGGLIGSNLIYRAEPDGLTIGDINAPGDYFAQIANAAGAHFQMEKFGWIGRPDNDPAALAVHPGSDYDSFDDLTELSDDQPISVIATGKGSNEYNAAYITMRAFDIPFHMVAAFKGAHAVIAGFVSGQGDLMPMATSHMIELGDNANVIATQTTEPYDKLPGVPTVIEKAKEHGLSEKTQDTLAKLASVMSLGHSFVAPPEVPADRLEALRAAFTATFNNPEFIKKAKDAGLALGYLSGTDVKRMVTQSLQHQTDFKRLLSAE